MTPQPARILLVDDHPAVRQGLVLLLTMEGHHVTGQAGTKDEALAILAEGSFDLAVLDLSLEGDSGLDLLGELHERDIPTLVYTMHEDAETIRRTLRQGAAGYVTKRDEPDAALKAVDALMREERFLSPRARRVLEECPETEPTQPDTPLSSRERQVFRLLGRGATNAEIAASLHVSPRTVETYSARILAKLGLHSLKDLRKIAIIENQTD